MIGRQLDAMIRRAANNHSDALNRVVLHTFEIPVLFGWLHVSSTIGGPHAELILARLRCAPGKAP